MRLSSVPSVLPIPFGRPRRLARWRTCGSPTESELPGWLSSAPRCAASASPREAAGSYLPVRTACRVGSTMSCLSEKFWHECKCVDPRGEMIEKLEFQWYVTPAQPYRLALRIARSIPVVVPHLQNRSGVIAAARARLTLARESIFFERSRSPL